MIATLLWWNEVAAQATPDCLFWHEATVALARRVVVDELGCACRLAMRLRAGSRVATRLPPDLAFLEGVGQAGRLAAALHRLLDGARRPLAVVAGAVDQPALFAEALAALRPDIVAAETMPDGPEWSPWLELRAWARPSLASALEQARQDHADRQDRRRDMTVRYDIETLMLTGPPPVDPPPVVPHVRIRPGDTATMLLPACGARRVRLVLHVLGRAAGPPLLRLDGRRAAVAWEGSSLVTVAEADAGAVHLLDVSAGREALLLVAIEIGPDR